MREYVAVTYISIKGALVTPGEICHLDDEQAEALMKDGAVIPTAEDEIYAEAEATKAVEHDDESIMIDAVEDIEAAPRKRKGARK